MKKVWCFAVMAAAMAAMASADSATVVSATGKVEVERGGSWVALAPAATVQDGEVISTGFKSEAVLKYKDSVMKLGPLTRITLEKLSSGADKDDVSVFLKTGNIRSTVNHTEDRRINYTVRNQVATASVRGTVFTFLGNAKITCDRGQVAVTPTLSSQNGGSAGANSNASSEEGARDSGSQAGGAEGAAVSPAAAVSLSRPTLVSAGQTTKVAAAFTSKPSSQSQNVASGFSKGVSVVAAEQSTAMTAESSTSTPAATTAVTTALPPASSAPSKATVNVTVEWE